MGWWSDLGIWKDFKKQLIAELGAQAAALLDQAKGMKTSILEDLCAVLADGTEFDKAGGKAHMTWDRITKVAPPKKVVDLRAVPLQFYVTSPQLADALKKRLVGNTLLAGKAAATGANLSNFLDKFAPKYLAQYAKEAIVRLSERRTPGYGGYLVVVPSVTELYPIGGVTETRTMVKFMSPTTQASAEVDFEKARTFWNHRLKDQYKYEQNV